MNESLSFDLMRFRPFTIIALALGLLPMSGPCFGAVPEFRSLGYLTPSATLSSALSTSANGSVTVGLNISSSPLWINEAVRWTSSGEISGMGFPSGESWSQANVVSSDGLVIAGMSGYQGFRWTSTTGMTLLGYLPGDAEESSVEAISSDGQVLVGYSRSEHSVTSCRAFRWTSDGGMQSLGVLPDQTWSIAHGVSGNGSKIVGSSGHRPFLWEQAGGMKNLGWVDAEDLSGEATAISSDGGTIAGHSGQKLFIWTAETGMVPYLAISFPGTFPRYPNSISAHGEIVVGGSHVFVLNEGLIPLVSYLTSRGLNVSDWVLSEAASVSADGTTIVGSGIGPDGKQQAWMAKTAAPVTGPFTLTVGSKTQNSITLNWTSGTLDTGAAYELQVTTAYGGSWTPLTTITSAQNSFSHTGLESGTFYLYRIQQTISGKPASNGARTRTVTPAPDAFSLTSATVLSPSEIQLEWNDSRYERGYRIERQNSGSNQWVQVGELVENQVSFVDTVVPTLVASSYSYRIVATGPGGQTTSSNIRSITSLVLPIPASPTLTSVQIVASQSSKLDWQDVNYESGYRVERKISGSSGWTLLAQVASDTTTYTDSALSLATTYLYRVTAVNAAGSSQPSDSVTLRTPSVVIGLPSEYDPAFNYNAFTANLGVRMIVPQSDYKVLVGGDFTTANGRFLRLNEDGTVDNAFSTKLGTGPNFSVYDAVVQSDKKIIIVGLFTTVNEVARRYVARLNADGSLDTTFVPANIPYNLVRNVALQSDGKIVIAGWFDQVGGAPRANVARLLTTGALDTTFDPGTAGGSVGNFAMVVDPQDRVILSTQQPGYVNGQAPGRLIRLLANGALDTGFSIDLDWTAYALAAQVDGKIVAGGVFTRPRNHLLRVNSNGVIDETFEVGSGTDTGETGTINKIAIDHRGRIIIAGKFSTYQDTPLKQLARLNSDGSLDPNIVFGASGLKNSVAVDGKGRVLFSSSTAPTHVYRLISYPAPTEVPLTEISQLASGAVKISWADSLFEQGFYVERSVNPAASGAALRSARSLSTTSSSPTWTRLASVNGSWSFEDTSLDPATTYSYRIVSWGDGGQAAATTSLSIVTRSNLDQWRLDKNVPAGADVFSDSDYDGINLGFEYALGLDPEVRNPGSLPQPNLNLTNPTAPLLTLTYLRARSDVTYVVEQSPSLAAGSWTSVGVDQGSGAVGESVTASVPAPAGKGFLRLRIVIP